MAPGTRPASCHCVSARRSRRLTPRSLATRSPTGSAPTKDRRKYSDTGEQEQGQDGDPPEGGQCHPAEQDCRQGSPARAASGSSVKRLDSHAGVGTLHIY